MDQAKRQAVWQGVLLYFVREHQLSSIPATMKITKLHGFVVWAILTFTSQLIAQKSSKVTSADVYVDKNGVMRWAKNKSEVVGFGVNYTVPFAHAYRSANYLKVNHEKAIDDDVYHFARLGFDAFRVHVWDTEISDSEGNLLENVHLKLFDYALKKMKERGIKFIITPIAYWGNGYPEADEKTPGFASKYGKAACLTNPGAIQAQETYLFQFLNHVNSYTQIAYKDDPDIIAFEISNEPHHGGSPDSVTLFINRMVAAMRKTGCLKPILYNVSHSIHLADAYFNANIQGGTFQWYPTGLGFRRELGGNLLANVEKYAIPFANHQKFKKMAKIVYEFDAADVGRSYIYPAMARSFRQAGIQFATHFAYDPTFMAHANTEYNTHYMNLAYAPQKALSLKICSEIFHTIPLYKDFGNYPGNTSFDAFTINYENDLAEMVSEKKFIYTNHTSTNPPAADKLQLIAGFGNSPIIKYEGLGAYFLDQIEKGVWRLEVMPDAIWVQDPFGRNSLKRELAVIQWNKWSMSIRLPDIGENFSLTGINDGNKYVGQANGGAFTISPGTYLLVKQGVTTKWKSGDRWRNFTLNEFIAPASTVRKTYVVHEPTEELGADTHHAIEATIIAEGEPESVDLLIQAGFRPVNIKMEKRGGYKYTASVPERFMREGFLKYHIVVKANEKTNCFPSGREGNPNNWDFYDPQIYQSRIVNKQSPTYIFNALTDADQLARPATRDAYIVQPQSGSGKAELHVNINKLSVPDPENPGGPAIYDHSFRYYFAKKLKGRMSDLAAKTKLVIYGRSLLNKPCPLQLALVMKDGSAYGGIIAVGTENKDYELQIADLRKVKLVSLPRPYPTFLPYYFDNGYAGKLDLNKIESLQFSLGPGIPDSEKENRHGFVVESVRLE